jgi:hypothetical protein
MGKARVAVLTFLAISLCAAPLAAQAGPQSPTSGFGWGAGRLFNSSSTEVVHGQVLDVQSVPSAGGGLYAGLHVMLQTPGGPLTVYAGPESYLRGQGFSLSPGDEIAVTGSRTNWAGQPAMIATSIQRGDAVVQLRSPTGVPGWSGAGRGGGGRRGFAGQGRGWGRAAGYGRGLGPCRRWW